ncbi:uncharacterized protein isoform X1 [Rhodnius prolixus]|uniref:uncharacterized protein isoform X1 n=1 Tax=Rhodnius prolixus TaxID=13249 RepID=UPI003D188F0E
MDIWDSQNPNLIRSEMNNLVIKMNNHIDSRDIEKFVIQLRLAGEKHNRFYIKDKKYVFNSPDVCPLCMRETDNLIHFYLCCRFYADLRSRYINKHILQPT